MANLARGSPARSSDSLEKFNDGSVIMPDGRPAKIIHCILSGKVTWKDLGMKILNDLEYKLKGRHQAEIWDLVVKCAELQGVVGIHFDECQHVFSEDGDRTNQQILDSFKMLLKDLRWPLMLMLSGIPTLARYVEKEEQLARLLRTDSIRGDRPEATSGYGRAPAPDVQLCRQSRSRLQSLGN